MTQPSNDNQTRRDALARLVASRIPMLTLDELRVIDVILGRICSQGRDTYGALDLSKDKRDFEAEGADEIADFMWYAAIRIVQRNDERLERLRCEAEDELARTNPVEKGLRELRDVAPEEKVLPTFDLGGES